MLIVIRGQVYDLQDYHREQSEAHIQPHQHLVDTKRFLCLQAKHSNGSLIPYTQGFYRQILTPQEAQEYLYQEDNSGASSLFSSKVLKKIYECFIPYFGYAFHNLLMC